MGPIQLNVCDSNNLYDAWDAQHLVEIEDFNCRDVAQSLYISAASKASGNITSQPQVTHPKCTKETWISELPKVLIFSINRVQYDLKNQSLIKNNKRFEFEHTIYADRFMYQNKNRENELDEIVKKLKENKASIQASLDQYKEYFNG